VFLTTPGKKKKARFHINRKKAVWGGMSIIPPMEEV
jgi:hypothetical protein